MKVVVLHLIDENDFASEVRNYGLADVFNNFCDKCKEHNDLYILYFGLPNIKVLTN